MVGLKRIFTGGGYTVIQQLCIVLQCAYSGLTLHMQNLLCACSFVGTEAWISHEMPFLAHLS